MLTNALIWTDVVAILGTLFENAAKMALTKDQDMVQTLFANRAHTHFGKLMQTNEVVAYLG